MGITLSGHLLATFVSLYGNLNLLVIKTTYYLMSLMLNVVSEVKMETGNIALNFNIPQTNSSSQMIFRTV